jgi:hypothetical protein
VVFFLADQGVRDIAERALYGLLVSDKSLPLLVSGTKLLQDPVSCFGSLSLESIGYSQE